MLTRAVLFATSATLALLVSGCVSGGLKPNAVAGATPVFDANTGAVQGTILSDEELPIAGASAAIQGFPEAVADATGVFVINFVTPGAHQLVATAPGYTLASTMVEIRAGEVLGNVLLLLSALPSDAPYQTTTVHSFVMSGSAFQVKSVVPITTVPDGPNSGQGDSNGCIFVGESATVKTCQGGGDCGEDYVCEIHYGHCATAEGEWGAQWSNYGCDFGHEWQTIIGELTSRPPTATTGQGWAFTQFAPNVTRSGCPDNCDWGSTYFDDPRNFRTVSRAPIQRVITRELLVERGVEEKDWCCDWGWRLFVGPCAIQSCDFPVNADQMQDQPGTVYFSYFMRAPAPEGWSAVTDT